MAHNVINNNPTNNNTITNNTSKVSYKTINNTTNFTPKKSYGRGALYGIDQANNWFGGLADTLTGFGVLRFFLLVLLFLVFLRALFSATGVVKESLTLFDMFTLMENMDVLDYSWVDKVSSFMTDVAFPVFTGNASKIMQKIFEILFYPIKLIMYMFTAIANFINFLNGILAWFVLK